MIGIIAFDSSIHFFNLKVMTCCYNVLSFITPASNQNIVIGIAGVIQFQINYIHLLCSLRYRNLKC